MKTFSLIMAAIDPSGDIGAVLNEHGLDKTFWVEKIPKGWYRK